ncbi:FadR/GntR family transcriptional regulator [Virgibacillus kekensis]|uniref:FadR/GntR family transcriptional regulator n=1 Tax=Virgibacillus kekensis TaxID=202261 RepID=A0ABV9DEF1_9BACI
MSISSKQKVYQGVLQEIRKYIYSNDLSPGDKLPSERELAEKLAAGRSSVREALRAIELLGLIETRHGEGTYLSVYRPYQTVELLASFILQDNGTRTDLLATKRIMEKEAAKIVCKRVSGKDIERLSSIICNGKGEQYEKHLTFFNYIFKQADNLLLTKVWQLMEEFSFTFSKQSYDETFYTELIKFYKEQRCEQIEGLFSQQSINN